MLLTQSDVHTVPGWLYGQYRRPHACELLPAGLTSHPRDSAYLIARSIAG